MHYMQSRLNLRYRFFALQSLVLSCCVASVIEDLIAQCRPDSEVDLPNICQLVRTNAKPELLHIQRRGLAAFTVYGL